MALRKFPSGACVLQLNTNRDEEIAKVTSDMVLLKFLLTLPILGQKVVLCLWASIKVINVY